MTDQEARAIVTLALMAAFADGDKHAREREEIKRIADGFSRAEAINLPTLYQDVLMQRVSVADLGAQLRSHGAKQLAYEMAVCVCDADGAHSEAEYGFLGELRASLGLDAAASAAFTEEAQAIAAAPLAAGAALAAPGGGPDPAELDQAILNAAILNGALELLPETLSTMAIIPLQMKLVYRVGKAYGFELDSGHIKDFVATVGVGLTSQYLEQAGRKLLGGLLGKVGGGLLGGLGKQAVSSGMSFATTYALGHVARRYYAGGRQLSTEMLKGAYASVMQEAQGLQARYLPAMQEKARTLDPRQVLSMVRGG
ncbi:TerB family tellurite resistance protein [Variovorax sp. J31P207]|uniref:YcjF family protein n=1 Tax=Variovorax sp. J31P207 TaxID=3053510 RepID=UPI0025762746|nr:TerB family tellurite resistance protein [Variovorax sp. J31P207]MDM0070182.1 TerB family tellurite resistance protein [Variovorax sp. J31P207]